MAGNPISWREEELRFETVSHDPASAPHPRLAAAYDAWVAAAKVDGVALRSAIEIERLPDVQGQVGIVDVLDTGEFRYRLFGSGLVGALGYDATGKRTTDLRPPHYAALITRQYQDVVAGRQPVLHETRATGPAAGDTRYFRLTVPLTLGNGRVDQLWLTVALLGTFGREVFLSDGSPFFRPRD